MASFLNVCRFNAASSGTGDFVVSTVVTGYDTPAGAGAVNGATYRYRAESTDLTQWELGYGAYTSGTTTLARTTIIRSSDGTTKVSFSAAPQVGIVAVNGDFLDPEENLSDVASASTAFTNIKQAATTSATGVVELATAAEMVTGTDTGRVPSVSVVQNHKGVAKGWAYVASDGTLNAGYNITSAKDSTGIYSLTLGTDMASANYAVVGGTSSGNTVFQFHTLATGSFKMEIRIGTTNVVADAPFFCAVFGDQ